MAWFRLWRFRRRYRRNLGQLARLNQGEFSADVASAADKFAASLHRVTLEEWQRHGLHERKWR